MLIPALSQSRQALLACPHSYVEQVIRLHKGPDSEASRRGTALHAFLSEHTKYLVRQKLRKDPAEWDRRAAGLTPDVLDILEDLKPKFEVDPDNVFATEFYIGLDENFAPFETVAHFEMTVDLITLGDDGRTAIIDDYKSNFSAFDADTFQGRLYSLGLLTINPTLEQVEFRLQFLRWGVKRSVKFTRENIPELQKEARQWREVQVKLHTATLLSVIPGAHCQYCPLLGNRCPIENNPAATPEAELLRVFYYRLAAKKAEETVRAYTDITGPLYAEDAIGNEYAAEWTMREEKHYSLDCLPTILDWQKKKKDPVLDKLRVSGLSAPLKAKKRSDLADALANFCSIVPKSVFKVHKVKATPEEEAITDADER